MEKKRSIETFASIIFSSIQSEAKESESDLTFSRDMLSAHGLQIWLILILAINRTSSMYFGNFFIQLISS